MIPEPDYSDSGEDVESEEDDISYSRTAFERLPELTEVYVSNVDSKKTPAKPKKADSNKTSSPPASVPKQTKGKPKDVSKKPTAKKPPPTSPKGSRKSPPTSPKGSRKSPPTSPKPSTEVAKTKVTSSPKRSRKSPPRSKSPPPASKASKPVPPKASPSTVKKTKTTPEPKPKSPPPVPVKTKTDKSAAKGKTSPKTKSKEKAGAKKATPGGDAVKSPPSSPKGKKARSPATSSASEEQSSEDELIKPKKPVNPYKESSEMQKLQKELKFSQKYGKLGVSSKTELQLALERYTENKMKRELNAEEKTSLEKILEFQAKKIEMQETMDKNPAWIDRLQKPPASAPEPEIDEFYRVHARVVSSSALTHGFLSDDDHSECSSCRRSDSGSSES